MVNSNNKAIILWGLANLFFALQFVARLSVGVLRDQLMHDFELSTDMFASLSGYYYLGYGISQIPLGIMLDRLSYRFVTTSAISCTALGIILFASFDNWYILLLSRFLTGFGSGICFLSVAKITKLCFDEKYQSMLIGFAFTLGLIGAVFSTTPLIILFDQYGYHNILNLLAIVIFAIGGLIFIFGDIKNCDSNSPSFSKISESLLAVICKKRLILLGVAGGMLVGTLEGFADVWAIPFFSQVYGFSVIDSSYIIMYVYFGMCLGGPVLVFFSNLFRSEYLIVILSAILTIIIFTALFYLDNINLPMLCGMMLSLGILCCYQVLVFSIASSEISSAFTGLTVSTINCINMSFGYIFHAAIGKLFILWGSNIAQDDSYIYAKSDFIYALSIIPIGCVIGIGIFCYLAKSNTNSRV